MRRLSIIGGAGFLACALLQAQESASFAKDVAPIFAANCAGCHGRDGRSGAGGIKQADAVLCLAELDPSIGELTSAIDIMGSERLDLTQRRSSRACIA